MCKIGRSRVLRVCLCSQAFVYLLVEDFDFHYLRVLVLFDGVEHSFLGETLTGLNLEVDLTLLSVDTDSQEILSAVPSRAPFFNGCGYAHGREGLPASVQAPVPL